MGRPALDRRARRTRERLRNAIVELTLDKGYQAVTVDHIVERADVTRATFYAHFQDKEHLLTVVTDDVVAAVVEEYGSDPLDLGSRQLELLFQHAERQPDLFRVILRGEGDGVALRRLRDHVVRISRATSQARRRAFELQPRADDDLMANMFAGEVLAVLAWWIELEERLAPVDVVREMRKVSAYGRLWASGIDAAKLGGPEMRELRLSLPPRRAAVGKEQADHDAGQPRRRNRRTKQTKEKGT